MEMNTNIALVLVLAPFLGFLINVFFGKALENHFLGIIGTLSVWFLLLQLLISLVELQQPEGIRISLLTGFKSVLSMLILDFNWTNCLFYGCFCNGMDL
jgi:NADH:ubiquinone oxidoreductase subunit 5 (subunit L)/multisubunit Na+/H+ antiporter MnhA subunit